MQQVFVFVVCGGQEHIDTLNFSLQYLRHFSKKAIWVVTDNSRNEGEIQHTDIIDVETPKEMDNHQASIYLKTGLHKFLPHGNLYCYLDTDIMALDEQVDEIFKEYVPPITFAPDHCVMKYFSSSALTCSCMIDHVKLQKRIDHLQQVHNRNFGLEPSPAIDVLHEMLESLKQNKLKSWFYTTKYNLSGNLFKMGPFVYDKADRRWDDQDGNTVEYDDWNEIVALINKELGFVYDEAEDIWKFADGKRLNTYCTHLPGQIAKDFGVSIKDQDWQHWNGGVFLFDDQSHDFLEAWHQKCLFVFKSPDWRTRDQGALIATVWEFGLENHTTLSKKWNFIVDTNNSNLIFEADSGEFSDDDMQTVYKPSLIHVYHDFGKTDWEIWQWIEELGARYGFKPYSHYQRQDAGTSNA